MRSFNPGRFNFRRHDPAAYEILGLDLIQAYYQWNGRVRIGLGSLGVEHVGIRTGWF